MAHGARVPGMFMSRFDEYIKFENEDAALAFRQQQYLQCEYQELLRDVMGMANADVSGERHIVLGVEQRPGKRRVLVGIKKKEFLDPSVFRKVVSENLEPPLTVTYVAHKVDGRMFGILIVPDAGDKPYMMKRDFSKSLRRGDAWIRRGSKLARLDREGLESIYADRFQKKSIDSHLEVSFSGTVGRKMLELPVLSADDPPSKQAAKQIRACIRARERADEILGHEDSKIQRLMHVNIFGTDASFESRDLAALKRDLQTVATVYRKADKYYFLEENAHKVNLSVVNLGEEYLEDTSVVLEIPVLKGVAVASRIYLQLDARQHASATSVIENQENYPTVERLEDRVRISDNIGAIPHHIPTELFKVPLRIAVSTPAIAQVVPVYYAVLGRNLRQPVTGRLELHVVEPRPERRISAKTRSRAAEGR